MNNFVRNLVTEWRKLALPFDSETFVVAVSGGADSLSLILALEELRQRGKLNLRFVVAHFNHDLRGTESDKDEEFVKNLAAEYKLELALGKGKLNSKQNVEQNARIARYEFLSKTAQNVNAFGVVTAHTLNDQAETFLINLIRGSGLEGLGGMKPIRPLENSIAEKALQVSLIRPLLTWAKRGMTEQFCHEKNIKYRYDTMNEDEAFKRVRVRKILLPLLKDFNPQIIESLAKTAFHLQDDFAALERAKDSHLAEIEKFSDDARSIKLKISDLKDLFPSMRRSILRDWIKKHRGDLRGLDSKHFEAIDKLIFSRKSGKTIELPNETVVEKENGELVYKESKA